MKAFLSLLLIFGILFIQSCATFVEEKALPPQKIQAPKVVSAYMSHKDIKSQFIALQDAKQMEDTLSEAAKKRIANLPKDELFISPKQLKELHKKIEKRKIIKSLKAKEIKDEKPKSVDRRDCAAPVVSQCGGTCTSHGITNAMDNLLCKPKIQDSSNQDMWNRYRKYSTWSGIEAASKYKICEDKFWPNCGSRKSACSSNRHIGLKSYKYLDNDVDAVRKALDVGHPLVYSGKVTNSWGNCDAVIYPKSSASGGGHAVAIVGYHDDPEIVGGGYFIIQNSWGISCGDKGFQYLPYYYMLRTDGGMYGFAHEIKEIYSKYNDGTIDPIDPVDPVDPPKPPKVCKKVRTCWRSGKCFWMWNCSCSAWKTVCE